MSSRKSKSGVDSELRAAVLARDGSRCQACGCKTSGQIHHIQPRGAGGDNAIENLMTLCGRCHMIISPVPPFALRRAFRIQGKDIPREKARVQEAINRFVQKMRS